MQDQILKEYKIENDGITLKVKISYTHDDFVRRYTLEVPEFGEGTKALLESLRKSILQDPGIKAEKLLDPKEVEHLKEQFKEKAAETLKNELPQIGEATKDALLMILVTDMLGIGKIDLLLCDSELEEIVVNNSKEPAWVYHKEFGWLKTNILFDSEEQIQNYANIIARRGGKQITILNPLLDTHLLTGDRANATLFPISGKGNTLTIRRFRRDPWTVTDFINNATATSEVMALIWLAMQYELNIIISGGTASGKTSFLNICLPFIQPNQRIISIEDTREIVLPEFLHWVPMTTREPNAEAKGGVTMLDLLVNSLRQRPDRIIVGETRRQREAEVMFEAMHTGHSVYTTFHANTADETIKRFVNPPIAIPESQLEAVHLNVVMFRNRRLGVRRILEVAEFIPERRGNVETLKANTLYRWRASGDAISKNSESIRLFDEISLHTGLTYDEIGKELAEKKSVLDWLAKNKIQHIQEVGKVMVNYYIDKGSLLNAVQKNRKLVDL
ncbi:MAG: CpaF family protein [Candidatus Diapherotrites archaeon]|uniref:CpaF family protein n=1 Tax=Candidatus Iainarchaeum sp. TaxID=3101447 RepID=A0A8T3YNS2_9ARCH|nr:CpaF family protein [Candidatus Diapherotrites archaeon]